MAEAAKSGLAKSDPGKSELPATHALVEQGVIRGDDVRAAADAYVSNASATLLPLGGGYVLNLSAAVRAHPFARDTMADPGAAESLKRAAVRTAFLVAKRSIREGELAAAVEAYLADPAAKLFVAAAGYGLNIAAAIQAHPFARATLADASASKTLKRAAVETAILLAVPTRHGP